MRSARSAENRAAHDVNVGAGFHRRPTDQFPVWYGSLPGPCRQDIGQELLRIDAPCAASLPAFTRAFRQFEVFVKPCAVR